MHRAVRSRAGGPCALLPVVLLILALATSGCGSIRVGHKWVKDVELVGAEELDAGDVLSGLETSDLIQHVVTVEGRMETIRK